jgi:hypothetical protein
VGYFPKVAVEILKISAIATPKGRLSLFDDPGAGLFGGL